MVELELQYKKLREGYPLGLREDACLALLSPRYATCRACEDICPIQAIRVGETALVLAESCLNCGRCAAVCPMEALDIPSFMISDIKQGVANSVAVDCWKVPRINSPDGVIRIPCLGGMSAGRIADLAVSAGHRPVVLLDRGWCILCRAGDCFVHPASGALEVVRGLLEKAGMAASELPRLEHMPLPLKYMPAEIPDIVAQQQLSRRAFFGALFSKSAVAIDQVKHLTSQSELRRRRGFEREPVSSQERNRLLLGIQRVAKNTGQPLPTELFYRLEMSDACRNHLLCAKICPTGALDIYEEKNCSGLIFDSISCIGCGHCVTVCPNDAIQLLPNGSNWVSTEAVKLTRFDDQECPDCGQGYPSHNSEDVCPQCAKRRHLAASAFRDLFGSRE